MIRCDNTADLTVAVASLAFDNSTTCANLLNSL